MAKPKKGVNPFAKGGDLKDDGGKPSANLAKKMGRMSKRKGRKSSGRKGRK